MVGWAEDAKSAPAKVRSRRKGREVTVGGIPVGAWRVMQKQALYTYNTLVMILII